MEQTFLEILNSFGLPVFIAVVAIYALYKGINMFTKYLLNRDIKNETLEKEFREHLIKANEQHHKILMKNNEVFEKLVNVLSNVEKILK